MDFEAEGLLDGLEGEARTSRLELLERLSADGVSDQELKAACAEDRLAFLPIELAMAPGGASYSANEIARECGLSYDELTELWLALGMAASDPDEKAFGDDDLKAARTAAEALKIGVPKEALLEMLRVAGHGMSQLAATIRASVGGSTVQPGDTELELATRLVELERATRPHLETMLGFALRVHQRDQIRNDVVGFAELSSGSLAEGREMTICFADLVGFTRLGEQIPPDELGALAGRFSALARECTRGPARVVKTIGDAAMLVSPETGPLLDTALDLVERTGREGEDFPQIRVGIACGPALSRAGDWYGRPVNLASRVTDIARRGSVLATADVMEAATEGRYRWSKAGMHRIKGVTGTVPLWRLRRGGEGSEEQQ